MRKIVFDIGGFGVQYLVYQENKIFTKDEFLIKGQDRNFVLKKLAYLINKWQASAVGIATPGAINSHTGFINGLTGIQKWSNFNLYTSLLNYLKNNQTKIFGCNDANAALLGNLKTTPNVQNAIQITIGTGIGGAIYANGKIVEGANHYGGEFGYWIALQKPAKSYSLLVSSGALVRRVGQDFTTAKPIFKSNNPDVRKELEAWIKDLALFITNLQYITDPQIIFISGGIVQNKDFQKMIRNQLQNIQQELSYPLIPNINFSSLENCALVGMQELLKNA